MKKAIVYFGTCLLAFCLTACGSSNAGQENENNGSQETEQTIPSGSAADAGGQEDADSRSEETGEADGWSEEMEEIRTAVIEAVGEENYWPDTPMTPDLFEMYFAITPDMYEEYMAESPMISANVDTLVIVRAKEERADEVEEALNAYRDAKVSDGMQYPMNVGKIQASLVERIGNCVIFVQLGGEIMDDQSTEDAVRTCREANERALEAIRKKLEGN